jgi:HEAT repeat protein
MRKRPQIALVVFLIVLGVVIACQVTRLKEPSYHHKALSIWLQSYSPDADSSEADEAVRAIGTNGIPILLDNLHARDSVLKLKLAVLGMQFTPAATRHMRAEKGFSALGPEASNAVPAITAVYAQNVSASARRAAGNALVEIGPVAKTAIPALIDSAANTNSEVRAFAVYTLGRLAQEPDIVNPVLLKSLHDPDPEVRYNAAFGLGAGAFMGGDARAAVPALVETLKDTYGTARAAAAMALGNIHDQPAVVVPALTDSLHDPQEFVRSQAAAALGKFGTNAKPAFSVLVELLHDENQDVRNAAATALRAIDTEQLKRQ